MSFTYREIETNKERVLTILLSGLGSNGHDWKNSLKGGVWSSLYIIL